MPKPPTDHKVTIGGVPFASGEWDEVRVLVAAR